MKYKTKLVLQKKPNDGNSIVYNGNTLVFKEKPTRIFHIKIAKTLKQTQENLIKAINELNII